MTSELSAVVGLGANLGQPLDSFHEVLRRLEADCRLEAFSHLYESCPIGGPPQPRFINAAVRLRFRGDARHLMWLLLDVERALGRVRKVRWGPRTIDLDLLWVPSVRLETRLLHLPHPFLCARAFALKPLLDVAPDAVEPASGRPYIKYLKQLQGQQINVSRTWRSPWQGPPETP